MPRTGRPQSRSKDVPPPLPPETRTVGQLVAETLRLYGRRFWRSLPLGIAPAVLVLAVQGLSRWMWLAVMVSLGGVLLSGSYVWASALAADVRLDRRALRAVLAGTLAFAPVPVLVLGFVLPALAWLAFIGLVVPVIVVERLGLREAFARATKLARADYVHALGSLATLTIAVFLTQAVLIFLLRGTGDQTVAVAAFLANLVVSPILFLGGAVLYFDQAARVVSSGARSTKRRRDADVHHAVDADRSGGSDPSVESRAPARGQP